MATFRTISPFDESGDWQKYDAWLKPYFAANGDKGHPILCGLKIYKLIYDLVAQPKDKPFVNLS